MQPLIIGIAGGSGSGKTTIAHTLIERVGSARIAFVQHDAYYRDQSGIPLEQRLLVNYDHPASLETELLVRHLHDLRAGRAIDLPVYDFTQFTRTAQSVLVEPRPVVLVEGILIFVDPALRALFDIKVYVDAPPDLRFIRRLQRDLTERNRSPESVIRQYLETVRPMHLEFVAPSKRFADLILPEGGFNPVAIDILVARIRALLETKG
ncbi:uridine kinase [Anaerolineae bacterium CFX7]|nr:uridine kinase [Anaerolineae bacterium CFX7]RIK20367.1 MAG: uridine kinase [Chloroflexota bacterium]